MLWLAYIYSITGVPAVVGTPAVDLVIAVAGFVPVFLCLGYCCAILCLHAASILLLASSVTGITAVAGVLAASGVLLLLGPSLGMHTD